MKFKEFINFKKGLLCFNSPLFTICSGYLSPAFFTQLIDYGVYYIVMPQTVYGAMIIGRRIELVYCTIPPSSSSSSSSKEKSVMPADISITS
jgi:hypothetical protein